MLAVTLVLCQLTIMRGQDVVCAGCLDVWEPVCAEVDQNVSTARTFSNKCNLQAYNCNNDANYVEVHGGECRD
uniref:Kazal-like domain-containing protein n=2 Tax=Timema TaxID=61471 RepID=A0A7R9P1S5_9NEOP|nr:unnamed protein product [Timema bartmani]CAD7464558.1 unnamed protein product [Timema tahoe]